MTNYFSSDWLGRASVKEKSVHNYTGCPKSSLSTLNLNNLKFKSGIAKPNTYLRTRGLHNFFDIKYDIRRSLTRDL